MSFGKFAFVPRPNWVDRISQMGESDIEDRGGGRWHDDAAELHMSAEREGNETLLEYE